MKIVSTVLVRDASKRGWWPSASTCAFLASGLQIISFALYLWQRSRAIKFAGSTASFDLAALAIGELMVVFVVWIFLFGVAVEATALWGLGWRQRAVAPVIARLGQWTVASYVVATVPVFVLIALMNVGVFGVLKTVSEHAAHFLVQDKWVFQAALVPLPIALLCLVWASRGAANPAQRWACGGMLAVAILGVFNVTTTLFDLPVRNDGLWLQSLEVAVRAAMWAAVGALLRIG